MSSNRTLLWGVLLLALAGGFLYRQSVLKQEAPPSRPQLLFITGGSDPYWQMAVNGAKAAAKQLDADLEVLIPEQEEGVADQTKLLLDIDSDTVDGVAISPLNAETQTRTINALARKVNVVTFDSDAPLSERQCYVGTSNLRAGEIAGQLISEALPEGGKVIVLYANNVKSNMIERAEGFESFLKSDEGANIEVVATLTDEGHRDKCKQALTEALQEQLEAAGIVGMNAYHGSIILDVLSDQDQLTKIQVVAFDEEDRTLDGVAGGQIHGTVVQDPYMYGYEAIKKLTELHKGSDEVVPITGYGVFNVPCSAIRKDDVAAFREKLNKRLNGSAAKKQSSASKAESTEDA